MILEVRPPGYIIFTATLLPIVCHITKGQLTELGLYTHEPLAKMIGKGDMAFWWH